MSDSGIGIERLIAIFDGLGIQFLVGGSLASSIHGVLRATQDLDFVADLAALELAGFVNQLQDEFYADLDHIRECVRRGRPFNIIHRASAFKFDIFPATAPYHAEQLARRCFRETRAFGHLLRLPVASAEDSILAKLDWYRAGGEVSERQWNDVRGVFAVQRDRLDLAYLRRWATKLGVLDLLDRQLKERQA
jgi:hypothetical protein